MLLTREEMTHDFGGARFDPIADRDLLAFFFNQFLYGEVTGIQVGHWLYQAPDLEAARFLARQSVEEMGHVRIFLEILRRIGAEPGPAHRIVRFLATGFMGGSFPEHTCLEMAMGEGFVLMTLYALMDTIANQEIVEGLTAAAVQEEKHVAFGEERTAEAVRRWPPLRGHLMALSMVSLRAIDSFGPQIRKLAPEHPVIAQMPDFVRAVTRASELRLRRMGILERSLAEFRGPGANLRIAAAMARRYGRVLLPRRPRRLTDSYLEDPLIPLTQAGIHSAVKQASTK